MLEPFASRPREALHLADIARQLNMPHPTVRLHLARLEKQGILRKSTKGRLTLYALNFSDPLLCDCLLIMEKNRILTMCEKNVLVKEFIGLLDENIPAAEIFIFGSSVKEPKGADDIDLLVIGRCDTKKITAFSKRYNKPIELLHVATKDKITTTFKNEIIKKHLLVSGSEQTIRWLYW